MFQLSATFFICLIRYLNGNLSSNIGLTAVSIIALTTASLTPGLIPIDIFIVGYMKNSSGAFKPWAVDEQIRDDKELL